MSSESRKVYANPKQIKFLRSRARRKTFNAGRGSGKTTTLGFKVGMIFDRFPRSKWGLVGLTYVQLDLVVMPGLKEALEMMGQFEYSKANPFGTYVVGIKPPDPWPKPFKAPGKLGYQYCITHISGATLQLISQDRPETHRGLNLDGALADESALIKPDFMNKVILPTLRANRYKSFSSDPWHHGYFDFSSAPWTQEGMHIYHTEEAWQKELELRRKFSPEELKRTPPENLFVESTYVDNQEILPLDYADKLREELDPLEFEVEVLNRRIGKLPNCFYHAFTTSKHCYFESYGYQHDDKSGLTLYQSNDYHPDKPLDVSLDFNADICWALVGQEINRELRVVNSHYTKPVLDSQDTNIVLQTAAWFATTYENHPKKEAFVYGDPGGRSRSAATSNENKPFFDQFANALIKKGWKVFRRELTAYPRHKDKYLLINLLLEEANPRAPRIRINQNTNKVLIIAIQSTPVKIGDTFEKDKTSERQAKHREYATDGTDALDYWLWAKCRQLLPGHRKQQNTLYVV